MAETSALKIIHCVRAPIGGIFRHIADLAVTQAEAGHQVGIVCDSTTGGAFEAAQIEKLRGKLPLGVVRFPMRRSISPGDLAAAWKLYRYVANIGPDVVHGHGAKGGSYARLIGTMLRASGHKLARIYCPHGGSLHFCEKTLEGRVYLTLERALERLSDALIFVSHYEDNAYRAKVGQPRVPVTVAYNGLRTDEFEPITPIEAAADFLHIGMLRKLKGTDTFIEAFAALQRRGIAATGLIVGVGTERPRFEAQVAELGLADRIRFMDPMPIRQALPLARCVVLPSRAESMPYVVLETIAAGVPILASRVGGVPEIFGPVADRLLVPGDPIALADAMAVKQADWPGARAEAAALRSQIRPSFSLAAMAATIEAAYRAVLAAEHRGSDSPEAVNAQIAARAASDEALARMIPDFTKSRLY